MNNTSSPYLICINAEIKNGFTNCTKSNATVSLPIINIANQAVAQEPPISTVFKVLALVIVIILSLVGNFLKIGSIYQNVNKRMRTLSNYLIVNLSTADLLITICNMPRMILILLVGFEWRIGGNFGLLLCKITSTVPSLSLLVSTSNFVFIALDRFLAVFFPLRRPITRNVMVAIIAFTWILPSMLQLFFAIPLRNTERYIRKDILCHFYPNRSLENPRIISYLLYPRFYHHVWNSNRCCHNFLHSYWA